MKNILITTLAASSLWFTSCGDKKTDTGADKDGLNPAEAVENWQKDVTDGRVASLWDSLPEDYQGDVTKLAHNFGEKMDAELYNEVMSTMGSVSGLLKSKKSMILEMIKEQAPEGQSETISESYDSIVGLVSSIANSDAKDADGLQNLDVAKFLGDIQEHTKELASLASLAGADYDKIKEATIKLVSESGDSAVVNVTTDGNEKEVKLVKKGSRWLPEEMVNDWPKMMEEANKSLSQLDKMAPEDKQGALMMIKMVQTTVKELEKAESKEELMQKMQGLMGMMGGM